MTDTFTLFAGTARSAAGALADIALSARQADGKAPLLVFEDATGRVVDLDLRGDEAAIRARYAETEVRRGPGRPRLGVVAREVTLLPKHWDWLAKQPGGASVALRRLVEGAQKSHADKDRLRAAQERAYRFMQAMAGDQSGFEEATRALFAADRARFEAQCAGWPPDVTAYARQLAADCFETK